MGKVRLRECVAFGLLSVSAVVVAAPASAEFEFDDSGLPTCNGRGADGRLALISRWPSGTVVTVGRNVISLVSPNRSRIELEGQVQTVIIESDPRAKMTIVIEGRTEVRQICTGDGNETVDASESDQGLYIDTGAGDDRVVGSERDDVIKGGSGNDNLQGRAGDDSIDGGAGGANIIDGGIGTDVCSGATPGSGRGLLSPNCEGILVNDAP